MTFEKITTDLIRETKEPVVVEHQREELEKEKASVEADKQRFIKTSDERIARIDEMLAMFV